MILKQGVSGASVRTMQDKLVALRYELRADGDYGPQTEQAVREFQSDHHLKVDGEAGPLTLAALEVAAGTRAAPPPVRVVGPTPTQPSPGISSGAWTIGTQYLPVSMKGHLHGMILHWTAGVHNPTNFDRQHYHFLWNGKGVFVPGVPSLTLNPSSGVKPGYAAHTRGCNSGYAGASVGCMSGAVPNGPYGDYPMTEVQFYAMLHGAAQFMDFYDLKVTPQSLFSHAEAPINVHKPQAGKWDITVLPWDRAFIKKGPGAPHPATQVGNLIRSTVSGYMK